MSEVRYYGVSTGDGNNGVSHTFADYYVKASEPYRLAELAALSEFKAGAGQDWAKENMQIDGEADYTISVVFYESKETQEEREEMIACRDCMYDRLESSDSELTEEERQELESDVEELTSSIEAFGDDSAWFIVEVFPEDDMREWRPVYESLQEAFGVDMVASVAA